MQENEVNFKDQFYVNKIYFLSQGLDNTNMDNDVLYQMTIVQS